MIQSDVIHWRDTGVYFSTHLALHVQYMSVLLHYSVSIKP